MRKGIFLTVLLWGLWSGGLQAQTQGQYIKAADEAFEKGDYYAALYNYNIVYEVRGKDPDLAFKFAEAARKFKAFLSAAPAYQEVLASKKADDYPMSRYWLAHVQKSLGEYDSARVNYQRYLDESALPGTYFEERALEEIQNIDWALEQLAETEVDPDKVVHLKGKNINTPAKEFAPLWREDGLYFSSLRFRPDPQYQRSKPYSQILLYEKADSARMEDGVDKGAYRLDRNFNEPQRHTAHLVFNRDTTRMFFTLCNYLEGYKIQCEIYYRDKKEDGTWSRPEKVKGTVNLDGATSTQPSLGYDRYEDRDILFFASDRSGGKGKLDIWYSPLDSAGNPGAVLNLEAVNTREDDMTPWYDNHFQMLYFSSEGHNNFGGFDIFEVKRQSNGWGEVQNLGPAINTSFDETHMSTDVWGDTAHFASNQLSKVVHDTTIKEEWKTCCSDIFRTPLNKYIDYRFVGVCDEVLDSVTYRVINASGEFGSDTIFIAGRDTFFKRMEMDTDYKVYASKPGYFKDSISISTYELEGGTKATHAFQLIPRIRFDVSLVNKLNGEPVEQAEVTLYRGGTVLYPEQDSNHFVFYIQPNRAYDLYIRGEDVAAEDLEVVTDDSCDPLEKELVVPVIPRKLRLPVFLFFDNDRPNPNTYQTTTQRTYDQTFERYISRRDTFLKQYTLGLEGPERDSAEIAIQQFFDKDVSKGMTRLREFAEELGPYLESLGRGDQVVISIRGFASPLASGQYNQNLTERRIQSVRNYFNQYYGDINKYIDNRKLIIQTVPYGEDKASGVSDDKSDLRNSIYGPAASRERRVEIIDIEAK